jgi:hypothetical protein
LSEKNSMMAGMTALPGRVNRPARAPENIVNRA